MPANEPEPGTAVPAPIARIADGRAVRAVWRNEAGGLTFEIGTDPRRVFAKWQPHSRIVDLAAEAERLAWAAPYLRVPAVLDSGRDTEAQWLLTTALPGDSAVAPRWIADPARAVAAIGSGLRVLHDTLPVAGCPFSWSVGTRLAEIDRTRGREFAEWDPMHQRLGQQRALELLHHPPPIETLVVCHGDPCAPNTLLGEDGEWSGHVDFGALGVADRWADLAVATWSTEWNFGPGWDGALLAAYGIAPDEQRSAYYRLLWDLSA